MNMTPGYTKDAISAAARVRVAMSENPTNWFFATTIDGQRPNAPPT
jgi:hypothetical protein